MIQAFRASLRRAGWRDRATVARAVPIVVMASCVAVGAPAQAQDKNGWLHDALGLPSDVLISGSARLRYEAIEGQSRAGLGNEDLTSIRTTLLTEYRGGWFRIGGELYDSRAYGANRRSGISTGEVNSLELVQAYVGARNVALPALDASADVQLGRFVLNLGSRRLIAADDFRNTTNGFAGARLDLHGAGGTTTTLIYTLPQQRRPDDQASIRKNKVALDREGFDLRLWGGVLSKSRMVGKTMGEVSYYGLAERDRAGRPTRNRHLHTVGGRLLLEPAARRFDYELEGVYQFGRIRSSLLPAASLLDVSAWFTHAEIGYSFPGSLKARLSAEYEYASGDGRGRTFNRFDTLFGSRRADLVPSGIYAQIGRANISTPAIRLEISPSKRFDAFVDYRAMWLANRQDSFSTGGVRDATGRSGSFAGHQIEGRARWWVVPALLRGEVNAAWIAKGRFLRDAPNAPTTGNTRYIAAAISLVY